MSNPSNRSLTLKGLCLQFTCLIILYCDVPFLREVKKTVYFCTIDVKSLFTYSTWDVRNGHHADTIVTVFRKTKDLFHSRGWHVGLHYRSLHVL